LISCLVSQLSISFAEDITIYPNPEGLESSQDFKVKANGKEVFVHDAGFSAFAAFSVKESASVEVQYLKSETINSWRLNPLSNQLPAERKGHTISFPIKVSQTLDLEINGHERPLFIFANPLPEETPKGSNIRVFEGGKVHEVGEISLQNNETIYLEPGAVVKGHREVKGKNRVQIRGYGLLDARGTGKAVRFFKSKDIIFDGPMVLNDQNWCFAMFECENGQLSNFKLINAPVRYTDGIDILGCSNISLDRFFILSGDDSIAIKTKKFGYQGDSKNISIRNGVVWNRYAGNSLEIGYEIMDEVSDVTFQEIDILRSGRQENSWRRAAISIHNSGIGRVHDITYKNIRIEEAEENHLWMGTVQTKWTEGGSLGTVSDVSLQNITIGEGSIHQGVLAGDNEESQVSAITFRGLTLGDKTAESYKAAGIQMNEHCEDISFE
jgi:hypothetical protein